MRISCGGWCFARSNGKWVHEFRGECPAVIVLERDQVGWYCQLSRGEVSEGEAWDPSEGVQTAEAALQSLKDRARNSR